MAAPSSPGTTTRLRPLVESPDDILVVAAGGSAGAFSSYIPGWGEQAVLAGRHQGGQTHDGTPRSHREVAPQALTYAPRLASLQGSGSALVDNTKFNSDRLLQKIGDILKAEHGVAETRLWRKRNASVPVDEAMLAEIRHDL